MKPKLISGLIALLCVSMLACRAETQTAFDQANTAFAEGHFAQAAQDGEALLRTQGFSAPVLFNLGNAYFREGKFGLAILNYERAKVLAPHDADINTNLAFALTEAKIANRPAARLERATHYFTLNALFWCGAAALAFLFAGLISRQIKKRGAIWRMWTVANVSVLMAVSLVIFIRWPEMNRAIVTTKNAPVYIAPATTAQPSFTLAEGQPVQMLKTFGEHVLIETADGHRGWANHNQLGQVMMSAEHGG